MSRPLRLSFIAVATASVLAVLLLVALGWSSTLAMTDQGAARSELTTHIVRRGDTLQGIARRYGISVEELIAANSDAGVFPLYKGMQVIVPVLAAPTPAPGQLVARSLPAGATAVTYTVTRGDRLSLIAARFDVTTDSLVATNGLTAARLYVGERLVIPVFLDTSVVSNAVAALSAAPALPRSVLSPELSPRATFAPAATTIGLETPMTQAVPVTQIVTVAAPAPPPTVTVEVLVTQVVTVTERVPVTVEVPITQVVTVTEHVPVTVVETITVTAPPPEPVTIAVPVTQVVEPISAPASVPVTVEVPEARVVTVTERIPITVVKTVSERVPVTVLERITVTAAPAVALPRAADAWDAPEHPITLFAPVAGGAYHSPLPVAALQRSFMGIFEVYLVGPDGQILARRSGSGMTGGTHGFRFPTLRYDIDESTPATFTLAAVDAVSGIRMHVDELPVVLLPGQTVLELSRPQPGAAACAPLTVIGYASTPTGRLELELRSANGELLETTTVRTSTHGVYRTFVADLSYAPATPAAVQLIAYAPDPTGASRYIDYTVYPLTLHPSSSQFCSGE